MLVFIVEDLLQLRKLFSEFFARAGWEVRLFPRPEGVLAAVEAQRPDIVITDYDLSR